MKDQEQEKMKYAEQLKIIESDLMRSRSAKELQELVDEEKRLDQELAQLEAEERAQELQSQELAQYHSTIQVEEAKYW